MVSFGIQLGASSYPVSGPAAERPYVRLRLFERDISVNTLENAPGPSPWYFRDRDPFVSQFEWVPAGDSSKTAGVVILSGRNGAVLLLDFHNYLISLDTDTLLVWHQEHVESGPTNPVVLRIFRISEFRPLEGTAENLCSAMRSAKSSYKSSCPPLYECRIPTHVSIEQQELTFPQPLRHIDELLILCHSSAVAESPDWRSNNLALLIARPSANNFQLLPQDWFNSASFDFMYQWVTRVARDPRTGRIHGEGVRINSFVLDETLRNIL